ncbi:nitroreductase [Cereibacter sphaeroides]|uniref:nitroreductase family protein n=1 Tax=Rhodobacterales TaxID=204455 RepID=UPI000BBEE1FB|nr:MULTISPECIES: nitroreductase [Paracoccaceae]MCE6960190.1 nitroreductase [Cereibacter sphaeroides]MCE6969250.1 nitroreductase [Cereibacter sphaeroides]MCE6974801.1 nitroreductase [Cereibacter sphaeroides]
MPAPKPDVLDFLLTRRSRPAKTLGLPVPSREGLMPILTAALRVPDHGKLEPWRLIVLERAAMPRLVALAETRADALGLDEEKRFKGRSQFEQSHLAVVVVASPKPSDKVPAIEQTLSAGAVGLSLLNAAEAAGWGANWLTGWPAYDRGFLREGLGLEDHEFVAGIIHIGSETILPPERPRPDIASLTTWVNE